MHVARLVTVTELSKGLGTFYLSDLRENDKRKPV